MGLRRLLEIFAKTRGLFNKDWINTVKVKGCCRRANQLEIMMELVMFISFILEMVIIVKGIGKI